MTVRPGSESSVLTAVRLGVDTRDEPVIFLRRDSAVARSEGFNAMSRVYVQSDGEAVIAPLVIVRPDVLETGQAGLSEAAWRRLSLQPGEQIRLSHPRPVESLSHVRSKIYGHALDGVQLSEIINDIVAGRYMDVHLAAFITACAQSRLNRDEVVALTGAMVDAGRRIEWPGVPIADKHSVGGLPGNRTTPIIVAIVTALGLKMPKTSSRAITSPSGTADTMETLAPIDLDIPTLRRVVDEVGGCVAWGGSVDLSPADDILIRVERALDIDSEGQLVASVLSKKIAAGSTHVVIDMPVGPTAKVRTKAAAEMLRESLEAVAAAFGMRVRVLQTVGDQPVGRGIGPALEARDVLAVLQNAADAPADLRERALALAACLLEMAGAAEAGQGDAGARAALTDGRAWRQFQALCAAQGGMREPPEAAYRYEAFSARAGRIVSIDNRLAAQIAKLAGAPVDKAAGLELHAKLGAQVCKGDRLMTIHAESPGELDYAVEFQKRHPEVFGLEESA